MKASRGLAHLWIVGLSSCDDSAVITNYIAVSPDQQHTIAVQTKQYGGPETAAIIRDVELQSRDGRKIGGFDIEHQQLATAGLTSIWRTSSEADIYEYDGKLDRFRHQLGGVTIRVHDIESPASY